MTTPTVAGELTVDLRPAVDAFGILCGAAAARLVPAIPEGVPVLLQVGAATATDVQLGELVRLLRPAGQVTVAGSEASGIGEVCRVLRAAYTRRPVEVA